MTIIVNASPLPVSGDGGSLTLQLVSGGPVYVSGSRAVSPAIFDSVLNQGDTITITDPVWLVTAVGGAGRFVLIGESDASSFSSGLVAVNVMDHGAKGDGVTDDYAALADAVSTATSRGRAVYMPAGTYKINSTLSLPSNVSITGDGASTVVDFSTATKVSSRRRGFRAAGSVGAALALTADANKGEYAVSLGLSDAASLSVGDWVQVYTQGANYFPYAGGTNVDRGEIKRVRDVTGTTVTFEQALYDNYATANSAKLAKVSFVENVSISGLKLLGSNTAADFAEAVSLEYVNGFTVRDCVIEGADLHGVATLSSIRGDVSHNRFRGVFYDGVTGSNFYAIVNYDSSQWVRVHANHAERVRHLWVCSSSGSGQGRWGCPRFVTVTGNVAQNMEGGANGRSWAYEHHGFGQGVVVEGNLADGCYGGFNVRGPGVRFANNTIRNWYQYALQVHANIVDATDIQIEHNSIGARSVEGGGAATPSAIYGDLTNATSVDVRVAGNVCEFDRAGAKAILFDGAVDGTGLQVVDNTVRYTGASTQSTYAIWVTPRNALIERNKIYGQAWGINCNGTGQSVVKNFLQAPAGASAGYAVNTAQSGTVIDGNVGRNVYGGVNLMAGANNATVTNNVMEAASDALAWIQSGGLTGVVWRNNRRSGSTEFYVNATDRGVDNTGASDVTSTVQAIITGLGGAGGGELYFPAGSYKIASSLTVPANVTLRGAGAQSTLDFSAQTGTFTAVTVTGSIAAGTALAGDAAEGDTTLNVSSSGFSDDDYLLVYSTATTGSMLLKKGEQVRLKTASTMTLEDPLTTGYAVADTAKVSKVSHVANVTLDGLRFLGPANKTLSITGIYAQVARNVAIRNCTFERCHNSAAILQQVWYARVSGCHVRDAQLSGFSYGFVLSNGAQDVVIENCTGERLRHLVTHGGGTGTALYTYGVARRTMTVNCTSSQNTEDGGFDCHPGAEDVSFIGCTVEGSAQDGIIHQGSSGTISGCTVRGVTRYGILAQPSTTRAGSLTITGNTIEKSGGRGMLISPLAGYPPASIVVTGNTILSPGATGIEVNGANASWASAVVTNNTIVGGASHGIYLATISGVACLANSVTVTASNVSGVYSLGVTNSTIGVNAINMMSSVGTIAIRVDTDPSSVASTGLTVMGNRATGAATGISCGNSSTGNTFGLNDMTGCTTPYLRGTGANIWQNNTGALSLATVASASTITLPGSEGDVIKISGTTTIDTITATNYAGRTIRLIFTSTAGLSDGVGNLKLSSAFTATADDVVTLCCDGTSWFEIARSVN